MHLKECLHLNLFTIINLSPNNINTTHWISSSKTNMTIDHMEFPLKLHLPSQWAKQKEEYTNNLNLNQWNYLRDLLEVENSGKNSILLKRAILEHLKLTVRKYLLTSKVQVNYHYQVLIIWAKTHTLSEKNLNQKHLDLIQLILMDLELRRGVIKMNWIDLSKTNGKWAQSKKILQNKLKNCWRKKITTTFNLVK